MQVNSIIPQLYTPTTPPERRAPPLVKPRPRAEPPPPSKLTKLVANTAIGVSRFLAALCESIFPAKIDLK